MKDRNAVEHDNLITEDSGVVMRDDAVMTTDESVRTADGLVSTPVLALDLAVEMLASTLGPLVDADYIVGKTQFRDALCARIDISQLEAEELVDDLERSGRVRFVGSEVGRGWHIQHEEETH